jgi:hypothetical protein
MKFTTVILSTCMLISSAASVQSKDWRGITPMKSTHADVERLLGSPVANIGYERYELSEETVEVEYVHYPCDLKPPKGCLIAPPVCALPPNTVLSITTTLRRPFPMSDMHLDLSKFEKVPDEHHTGRYFGYFDREKGFSVRVYDGAVIGYGYHPTKEDQKLFRCGVAN